MIPTQRQKVQDDFKKNSSKVAGSAQNRALQDDIAMFGDAAGVELPEPPS